MSFGEKLRLIASEDPDFARSIKRLRVASRIFGIAVLVALVLAGWATVVNHTQGAQITKVVKQQAACQPPVSKKRAHVCAVRIETGLQLCHYDAGCRKAFGSVTTPPGRSTGQKRPKMTSPPHLVTPPSQNPEGGDAVQSPSKGHQQHGPSGGHGKGTSGGTNKPPKSRKPTPSAESPPPIVDTTTAEPSPGNSGDTPSAEHSNGLQVCLEHEQSACVKVELPKSGH